MTITHEYDAVTVGEAMVLVTPEPFGSLRTATQATFSVAGAEATVARYLALLGHRTAWVSAVGADPFGDRVLDALSADGVDVSHVSIHPQAPTGVYFKDLKADGRTTVRYYRAGSAASLMTGTALMNTALRSAAVLHVSGITAGLSHSCHALVRDALTRRVLDNVTVSFDVNYRAALWDRDDAAKVLLKLAADADLVFVGLDEARELWNVEEAADVRGLLPQPRCVVVKNAEVGATAFVVGEPDIFEPAIPVVVVEPVGAGDAFAAGYLHGRFLGLSEAQRLNIGHQLASVSLRVTTDVGKLPDAVPRARQREQRT